MHIQRGGGGGGGGGGLQYPKKDTMDILPWEMFTMDHVYTALARTYDGPCVHCPGKDVRWTMCTLPWQGRTMDHVYTALARTYDGPCVHCPGKDVRWTMCTLPWQGRTMDHNYIQCRGKDDEPLTMDHSLGDLRWTVHTLSFLRMDQVYNAMRKIYNGPRI